MWIRPGEVGRAFFSRWPQVVATALLLAASLPKILGSEIETAGSLVIAASAAEIILACGFWIPRCLKLAALGTFAFGAASVLWHVMALANVLPPRCGCMGPIDLGHELVMIYASALMVCAALAWPRAETCGASKMS